MKITNLRASYPAGYLDESKKPSNVKHLVDGQWVEVQYKDKDLTDKRLKKAKKLKKAEKRNRRRGQKSNKRYKQENDRINKKANFYESKPWKRLRAKVLKTYGWQCMKCAIKTGIMQVDHIKPRSKFPDLELTFDNMQVLCKDCNMAKSNYHSTDYRGNFAELDILSDAEKHI